MRVKYCKRVIAFFLTLTILMTGAVPAAASDRSIVAETVSTGRAGMIGVDLSEEGVAAAQVSLEEFKAQFDLTEQELLMSEKEMDAECSGIAVSANDISAEKASYLTLEDAAKYLREKMVQRKELVTVKIGTTKVSALKNVQTIMKAALAYDENGAPDEGDYLYWHMSRFTWPRELEVENGTITIPIGIEYLTTASEEKFVTKKINDVVKKLGLKSASKTDYEKVRLIYDYVMKLITYDTYHYESGVPYPPMHSAYEALDSGYAVCQAYATVFYRLCEEAGICARVIPGNPDENGVSTHGWNIVKIGNEYYNLDATWDDTIADTPQHFYFLKNKTEFYDHTRQSDYANKSFEAEFPTATKSYPLPEETADKELIRVDNISGKLMLTDGSYFSMTASGKPKVLYFINPADKNSGIMLDQFYKNGLGESGYKVAVIDICDYSIYGASVDPYKVYSSIVSYAKDSSKYSYSSDYYNFESENGYYYRELYAKAVGAASGRTSLIVVVDGANCVRYAGANVSEITQLKEIVQRSEASSYGKLKGIKLTQSRNDAVKVTWSAYAGAKSYLVYRKTGKGEYICVGSTKKTSFTDETKAKKTYTYKVYAVKGEIDIACSDAKKIKTVTKLPKKGNTYTVGDYKYKVLTSSSKSKTVAFKGVSNKKLTAIVIPASVKIHGISYKVTQIGSSALKGNKKVKTVTIGSNVTKIGSNAFYGAKKLSLIVVKSKKITKVGSKALSGISSKAEIRVPSSKVKKYKKVFASKGQKKTVKIKKA